MHDESGERAGRFFLKQRGPQGIWYICWYNPATRQAERVSTGKRDREAARTALYEHALLSERPAAATDAALATVMQTRWLQYARHLPSADTHRAAQRNALEIWGDISVSGLDRKAQKQFVDKLRTDGLSDWTILSRLSRVFAATRWYKRDCATLIVPEQITANDWKPHLPDRERTFSVEELAALFNAAASDPAAPKPEKPPARGNGGTSATAHAVRFKASTASSQWRISMPPCVRSGSRSIARACRTRSVCSSSGATRRSTP